MNEKNDSLIEIAFKEMTKKRKPKPLNKIISDVFEIKGIEKTQEAISQFEMDFMLSGIFICCGEDKNTGEMLWDIKTRQESKLLDKEGNFTDPYDDDDDVVKNELTADNEFDDEENDEEFEDDDDDDNDDETDDIEEELYGGAYDEDDDIDEDKYDDEDE